MRTDAPVPVKGENVTWREAIGHATREHLRYEGIVRSAGPVTTLVEVSRVVYTHRNGEEHEVARHLWRGVVRIPSDQLELRTP